MSQFTGTYGFYPGAVSETYVPDQLVAGDLKRVTTNVTFGASVVRGQVVGLQTASGNYIPSVATATDGSQVPVGLAVDNFTIAAGNTSVVGSIYQTGEFNLNYVTVDPSFTTSAITNALRPFNIFLKTAISGDIVL